MTPTMSALTRVQQLPQALRFVLVGGSAAATHLLVVWALVQGAQWAPLWANGVAHLPWLAVDDRSWLYRPFCKALFMVDGRTGLTQTTGSRLAVRLQSLP